ncbi:MAG: DNA-processing protein DprA [Bacteroidia bacterium]
MNKDIATGLWALASLPGTGPVAMKRLLEGLGGAEALLGADAGSLSQIGPWGKQVAKTLSSTDGHRRWQDALSMARREWEIGQKLGLHWVTLVDDGYPNYLKECHDPPTVLFVQGSLPVDYRYAMAVVGTRNISHYGSAILRSFMEELAQAWIPSDIKPIIVSGLARGVDGLAHELALEMGFQTIAVTANGLGHVYPPQHKGLSQRMRQAGGAILTETAAMQGPDARLFPRRNRIIAGLVPWVLVAEAAARGGALITAQFANEYDRQVYVFPGRVTDQGYRGCLRLALSGQAQLMCSPYDLRVWQQWPLRSRLEDLRADLHRLIAGTAVDSATVGGPTVQAVKTNLQQLPASGTTLGEGAVRILRGLDILEEATADRLLELHQGDYPNFVRSLFALESAGYLHRNGSGTWIRLT